MCTRVGSCNHNNFIKKNAVLPGTVCIHTFLLINAPPPYLRLVCSVTLSLSLSLSVRISPRVTQASEDDTESS